MRLQVAEAVQETPSTRTFRLERLDGPLPPFRAGQYVNLFVDVDGVLTSRPYSISSPPPSEKTDAGHGMLSLTVRDNPAGFVAPFLLHELEAGTVLETSGPEGHFYHEPLIDGQDLVFLAGGSGITPFMSIIEYSLERASPLTMRLLYGSRRPDDVIFGDRLAELAEAHSNFEYALVISEPPADYDGLVGFLDANLIADQVGDVTDKTFYICGPGAMYDFCLAALAELGVPRSRIRRELFGPPADVTRLPGWPEGLSADTIFEVRIENDDLSQTQGPEHSGFIRAPAGEPLMNALERHGIVIPAICRTGACSVCRTRLVSGRVFAPPHTGLRESDREYGYIHPCMSYPLEDLVLRL
jgi:ferredoxin-NADP reductase